MGDIYLGLMSGTSLDGIDAVVIEFGADGPRILAAETLSYPGDLREQLLTLTQGGGPNEIERLGRLDRTLGALFADAALAALTSCNLKPAAIRAVGSHGQTVRHRPTGSAPFTLQIADPNLIAEITGITTVADFRRRDVAAGGQGAPLVPAFHAGCFRDACEDRAVLNVGGMANLTLLPADTQKLVSGFDTGPGNVLLDAWVGKHLGKRYDKNGSWAAQGATNQQLLNALLHDDYFKAPPPKSTGRERFNLCWLEQHLAGIEHCAPADVQATLVALTVSTVAAALCEAAPATQRLLVCGGGTHNDALMRSLASALPEIAVESTARHGLDPDWVEAAAFAWMARETLAGRPGNLPSVTGAHGLRVLGGIYPA